MKNKCYLKVFPGGNDIDICLEIENPEKLNFRVDGMVCPACAWLIHNRLSKTRVFRR